MLKDDEIGYVRVKLEIRPAKLPSFTFHIIQSYTNDTFLSQLIQNAISDVYLSYYKSFHISRDNIKFISFRLL